MGLFLFFCFLFGICIGSFLNVLIDRLPAGETVVNGRSHCDYCRKILRWFELIPLLSFLMQRGRCRRCGKRLSYQYPFIELLTGLGFMMLGARFIPDPVAIMPADMVRFLCGLGIFSCLLVIFVTDCKTQIIPDSMVIIGCLSVVLEMIVRNGLISVFSVLPSAVGASCFFYVLWFITRGRGMGFGDVKLAFLLGLMTGYPLIVAALYVAFLTGAVSGVILMIRGKKTLKSRIAFGPFLILGTGIVLFYAEGFLVFWKGVLP